MWILGIVIIIFISIAIYGGYLEQREKYELFRRRRLDEARRNADNHCATDEDWRIILENYK